MNKYIIPNDGMEHSMEILKLHINLTEINEVVSDEVTAKMLLFDGTCEGKYFNGDILHGGVDTQIIPNEGSGTLSARYILQGTDYEGNSCKIFIENNAVLGAPNTNPQIITDSKALKWLEKTALTGRITNEDGELIIYIYTVE